MMPYRDRGGRKTSGRGYFLEMHARTAEGWPLALTRGQTSSILPSLPMRKELRTMPMDVLPMNCFSCHAPNFWMVLWSGSLSRGKLRFWFSLKEAWAFTESALIPRMATPSLSKSSFASRNSDASIVQPEVLALGKRKRRTRWPAKSLSAISLPSSDGRRKAGALAPIFSIGHSFTLVFEAYQEKGTDGLKRPSLHILSRRIRPS